MPHVVTDINPALDEPRTPVAAAAVLLALILTWRLHILAHTIAERCNHSYRFYFRCMIYAPFSPVEAAAVQRVCALPEGQAGHLVTVARVALQQQQGRNMNSDLLAEPMAWAVPPLEIRSHANLQ